MCLSLFPYALGTWWDMVEMHFEGGKNEKYSKNINNNMNEYELVRIVENLNEVSLVDINVHDST